MPLPKHPRIAIVGAGISGLYCAERLAKHRPEASIALFEATPRLGGRLCSVFLKDAPPAELGALSFSSADENVAGLLDRFSLRRVSIDFKLGRHFIRGVHIDDCALADRAQDIFRLTPAERGMNPRQLLLSALFAVAPKLCRLWPFACPLTAPSVQQTAAYLRTVSFQNRPLDRCGWQHLLEHTLSHEACELIAATFGSLGALGSLNAHDQIWALLWEARPGQKHFRLFEGNATLARALAEASGGAAQIRCGHVLERLTWNDEEFALHFSGTDTVHTADAVVLALPQYSLKRLRIDSAITGATFAEDLDAVAPIGAAKLFLAGQQSRPGMRPTAAPANCEAITASMTDLPLRQSYWRHGDDDGHAIAMACFADAHAASFWSSLGDQRALQTRPSAALIETALAQLRALWGEDRIGPPFASAFADWSAAPFGAGWHAWRPGVQSWRVKERIRRPNPDVPLFICGEAYAQLQGWTEGAVNNAEMMLERHFGLPRPSWVRADYPFEI